MALRDSEAAVRKVLGEGVQLPVLADSTGAIGSSYGVDVLPTNVFVNAKGRIAKVTVGATTADELAQIASALK